MELGYLAVGVGLIALVSLDILWTTLWVDGGAGPLSARVSAWTWRGTMNAFPDRHWLLSLAGPTILVGTLVVWVLLIWAGWTLVIAAGDPAIVDIRRGGPIDWTDRIYFAAFTIVTLGMGDFVPADGIWQLVTTLATANGILFITLGVSYVLSVVDAVTTKRAFAAQVSGLGNTSESFVLAGWDGEDFGNLDPVIDSLSSQLDRLVEQHNAYPILHYYHTRNPQRAASVSVAIVGEGITILRHGVPDERCPNDALMQNVHESAVAYVGSLSGSFPETPECPPDPPDLGRLRAVDVPTVSDDEFEAALDRLDDHRLTLRSLVESDGWEWLPRREAGRR